MAASMRLLVRRVIRLSHRNVNVTAAGLPGRSGCCWVPSSCRCFSDTAGEKSTHFGFETVSESDKAKKVYKVFENVAQKYDVMNDAMSLGIHRMWKDMLLHVMHPQPGVRLLDVAGGTGDIAFRFLEYVRSQQDRQKRRVARSMQTPSWQDISNNYSTEEEDEPRESTAVVCDINKEMLKVGKQKADSMGISAGLSWVVGDAEELPFDDDQFDIYTIAFGIRNVTHIDQAVLVKTAAKQVHMLGHIQWINTREIVEEERHTSHTSSNYNTFHFRSIIKKYSNVFTSGQLALQEAQRVLKPGGRFMCLEFSKVTNPVLARLYDTYSFQVIPVLGEVIAGDWKSYQYLVESIRKFPDQDEFKGMIEDAGFYCVRYYNLTGGVVALHSGFKL